MRASTRSAPAPQTAHETAPAALAIERSALLGLCALLALGLAGLPAAMAGWFRPAPVGLGSVAVFVLLYALVRPLRPRRTRASGPAAVLAVALCVAAGAFNAAYSGEHVRTDRDPGVYTTSARSLARDGKLWIDVPGGPFREDDDLLTAGPRAGAGYSEHDDEALVPQFTHLLNVYMAEASWVGGDRALLSAPAVLAAFGLLLFFLFASRVMRSWWALAATAVLGSNLVFTHFARDATSEIVGQLLLFGGLWVLWDARSDLDPRTAALAGLAVGATAMARIDGLFYLVPLSVYAIVELVRATVLTRTDRRRVRAFLAALGAGAVVSVAIGVADLVLRSPTYFDALRQQVVRIALALLAVWALAGVAYAVRGAGVSAAWQWVVDRRRPLGWSAAGVIVTGALLAYFVRPLFPEAGTEVAAQLVSALQEFQGLEVESRSYAESSFRWFGYYLGPVTLWAGVAGWALYARRVVTRIDLRALPFLLVFSGATVAYLWDPQITPDHVWAMRRFLPESVPGLVLLALFAGAALWTMRGRGRLAARVGALTLAAVALGASIATQLPDAYRARAQDGMLAFTEDVCDTLGDDAAVLILPDGPVQVTFSPTLRSFCDVPVAVSPNVPGPLEVEALARAWSDEGRRLWLAADDPADVAASVAGTVEPTTLAFESDVLLSRRLQQRPTLLAEERFEVSLAAVPPG